MSEEVCVGGLGGNRAGWGSEASEELLGGWMSERD